VAPAPLDEASKLFGYMAEAVINCNFSPASGVGSLSTSEPPMRGLGRGGGRSHTQVPDVWPALQAFSRDTVTGVLT